MGVAVKREWIEAAQRERKNGAKATARWDDEGGGPVSARKRPKLAPVVNLSPEQIKVRTHKAV